MKNYIINNNTIAIIKSKNKTIILDVNKIRVINKNIISIIKYNCLINGYIYEDIKNYTKNLLNINYKVPIYLNKNIVLIQINSLRDNNSLIILLNNIINYKYINNKLIIKCNNNYNFICNLTKNKLEKLLINGIIINNNIND